jgi:regulation of enolase protein 1 (concanavalin A-like superfamily)
VTASGADIWNTADAFHFVYQQLSGDGQIVARVASVQNTDAWAKAGVMIRASLAAGSAQAFMGVTPGNGVVYQRRTTTGGITTHSPGPATTAPYWVRLVRASNVVTGYASADGSTWTAIGSDTLPLGTTAYFGLAVTSHNNGVLCLSTFDTVSLAGLAQSLPPPWLDGDVGGVGAPGAGTFANGTFTATGSGADIWGTADQFHFIYRPLAGDGQITARVATVPSTDPWGKAGVMIRETLATGSAHGMMIVSNARGAAFQWRSATGGTSSNIAGPAVTAPYWVRLVRSGNLISAYASANGTTFTLVGSATIPMAANVLVGLPVTSHNNLLVGTATFTDVQ